MHEVDDGKLTMSTGVVFAIKDVPILAFGSINRRMAKDAPKVPVVYIEGKARNEENPNDPAYIEACEEYDLKQVDTIIDMVISLGTEVHSLPSGFLGPELNGHQPLWNRWFGKAHKEPEWTRKLRVAGVEVPVEPDKMYVAWVKLCAAPTIEDIHSLVLACSRSAGVTEEDVADSAAIFRDRAKRRSDRGT